MSDMEEPPIKISKLEFGDEEGMEEGQEEWLSEGVLTDDDYNLAIDQDNESQGNTSQDEASQSQNDSGEIVEDSKSQELIEVKIEEDGNIEKTLNSLDTQNELSNDLNTFLIRKTNVEDHEKKSDDDGNSTDDLLRMLSEDKDKGKNKILKKDKSTEIDMSSDDEFEYDATKVKHLRVAKNALIRRPASKAVPEDMEDGDDDATDASSDEANTLKKMFSSNKRSVAAKSKAKSAVHTQKSGIPVQKTAVGIEKSQNQLSEVKPIRQYVNKKNQPPKSILKPNVVVTKPAAKLLAEMAEKEAKAAVFRKSMTLKPEVKAVLKPSAQYSAKKGGVKFDSKVKVKDGEHEEIIDEEEFLEDDDFTFDEEEFAEESEMEMGGKQRIMRPEQMDEEVPTDTDSLSDDASLYDELPSSDTEDLEEWFTLDIRTERAGDYIPLLGSNAYELLTKEKLKVNERLTNLKESLTSLKESGRFQAQQLHKATMTIAELDDLLKAS